MHYTQLLSTNSLGSVPIRRKPFRRNPIGRKANANPNPKPNPKL